MQGSCTVQMLKSLFEIDIIFVIVSLAGVFHVLFYIKIYAIYSINKLDKALEICIYIILDRNSEKIGYRLHCSIRPVSNRRVDTV
ncbi:hypothetical protein D3C76_1761650 [compost metagenome]